MPERAAVPVPLPDSEIAGAGLLLRPHRAGCAQEARTVLRGLSDPEFLRWNVLGQPMTTPEDVLDYFARMAQLRTDGRGVSYAVTEAATGVLLGQISLRAIEPTLREARVGYWVLPEARGRGVARRALALLSRWAFEEAGLHRVELGHAAGHAASCRVAERCGYRPEGLLREAMFADSTLERYRDLHLHARLAGDPEPAGRAARGPGGECAT
ncbi:GNAT family N-acetyltransferase [Streptomyces sp. NPDC007088]|uniref:GNAT family N-acetyltransferase n=1 Tax=Streptomyces sp. NPDC007088 TaxID=3364773 RepID=UPI00369D6408